MALGGLVFRFIGQPLLDKELQARAYWNGTGFQLPVLVQLAIPTLTCRRSSKV